MQEMMIMVRRMVGSIFRETHKTIQGGCKHKEKRILVNNIRKMIGFVEVIGKRKSSSSNNNNTNLDRNGIEMKKKQIYNKILRLRKI